MRTAPNQDTWNALDRLERLSETFGSLLSNAIYGQKIVSMYEYSQMLGAFECACLEHQDHAEMFNHVLKYIIDSRRVLYAKD